MHIIIIIIINRIIIQQATKNNRFMNENYAFFKPITYQSVNNYKVFVKPLNNS